LVIEKTQSTKSFRRKVAFSQLEPKLLCIKIFSSKCIILINFTSVKTVLDLGKCSGKNAVLQAEKWAKNGNPLLWHH